MGSDCSVSWKITAEEAASGEMFAGVEPARDVGDGEVLTIKVKEKTTFAGETGQQEGKTSAVSDNSLG